MNTISQNQAANNSPSERASRAWEETLHRIAALPAPEGLEDRVYASLRTAQQPAPRKDRLLAWPGAGFSLGRDWMRSAAAAAIVFVVAGGGWGIYTRVQTARGIVATPHIAAPSGFSSAGAMRTPNTLNGPAAPRTVMVKPQPVKSPAKKPLHKVKTAAADKTAAQPVAPVTK